LCKAAKTKVKEKYTEQGIPDKLSTHIFNGGHCFDDEAKEKVYSFIDKELMN